MLKRGSDALELSTYTRRLHFFYNVLEYMLIIVVSMIAIGSITSIFIEQLTQLVGHADAATSLSSALNDYPFR